MARPCTLTTTKMTNLNTRTVLLCDMTPQMKAKTLRESSTFQTKNVGFSTVNCSLYLPVIHPELCYSLVYAPCMPIPSAFTPLFNKLPVNKVTSKSYSHLKLILYVQLLHVQLACHLSFQRKEKTMPFGVNEKPSIIPCCPGLSFQTGAVCTVY